jgi:predicted lipoprotein with Yx(FWY)xxD motif
MDTSVRGWRSRLWAVAVAGVLLMAACAGKSTTAASGGGGGTTQPSNTFTVETQHVPDLGAVIADGKGMTLYHLKTEVNGSIACTGSCASVWPPLLVPSGSTKPTEGAGATGRLGTVTRPDGGVQVTYDGLPVYRYSGDTSAGQANGQGIQGVWFAITPSGALAGASSGSGSPSSSPTGGGYGY